jgi:hypothetical protein
VALGCFYDWQRYPQLATNQVDSHQAIHQLNIHLGKPSGLANVDDICHSYLDLVVTKSPTLTVGFFVPEIW